MSYAGATASVAEPQEPCGLQAAGLTPTIAINPKSHNPKSDAAPSEAGVKAGSERRDARIRFLCRNAKASLAFALD